jgi:hypothetical protein
MMAERVFYVYLIFRPDGRPCYVGKGQGGRWEAHFKRAGNPWLSRIIAAAGGDLPVVKVRENLTEAEAFETEVALIKALGRKKDGGPLVNLTDGGEGVSGLVFSAESRARFSEANKANWKDPEYRTRIAEARKAQWESPEARARLSEAAKAQWESPEARARMSEARKSVWRDPEYKARMSEAAKIAVASPEARDRLSKAAKARFSSPEARARLSEIAKTKWQNPIYRAKTLATRAKAAALKKAAKEAAD